MGLPKNAGVCRVMKSGFMLRFLPYVGRDPYRGRRLNEEPDTRSYVSPSGYGRWEECFFTRQDATARFRELRKERRISEAQIIHVEPGRGGGESHRTLVEWEDRMPRKAHKRRR